MTRTTRGTMVALVIALISIWVALAAGVAAVWLTSEARMFGLVILPAAIIASLLVLYFEWRARLRQRRAG